MCVSPITKVGYIYNCYLETLEIGHARKTAKIFTYWTNLWLHLLCCMYVIGT